MTSDWDVKRRITFIFCRSSVYTGLNILVETSTMFLFK